MIRQVAYRSERVPLLLSSGTPAHQRRAVGALVYCRRPAMQNGLWLCVRSMARYPTYTSSLRRALGGASISERIIALRRVERLVRVLRTSIACAELAGRACGRAGAAPSGLRVATAGRTMVAGTGTGLFSSLGLAQPLDGVRFGSRRRRHGPRRGTVPLPFGVRRGAPPALVAEASGPSDRVIGGRGADSLDAPFSLAGSFFLKMLPSTLTAMTTIQYQLSGRSASSAVASMCGSQIIYLLLSESPAALSASLPAMWSRMVVSATMLRMR